VSIEIRRVRSHAEATEVFRLRYEVYIAELDRTQRYADPAARMIEEPLDRTGHLFGAYEGARLVGTLRSNYAHHGDLGEYGSLYEMSRAGAAHPSATSITTKLLVAADYRNTSLAYRLAAATYAEALGNGILFDFIDVYPARVPLFERLGYRVHIPEVVHSEFGRVIVMRLALLDAEHLRRVGSPFLKLLERYRAAAPTPQPESNGPHAHRHEASL
jgi:hypothetical protein